MSRSVKAVHAAQRDDIADLVTRRPVPGPTIQQLDPFLFLNHHGPQTYAPGNQGLPFGPHPHRGFETVTFIIEGELSHADSAGHESIITEGGVQWMTAGRGLVHAELSPDAFKKAGGPLEILQLWVNLPSKLKMTQPRYVGVQKDAIPVAISGGATVSLTSGEMFGAKGPVDSLTGIVIGTVALDGPASLPAPKGRAVFLYVIRGEVTVAGRAVQPFRLVELNDDGDTVDVAGPGLLLYGHADPIGEPVVSYGPFVMNTREEIVEAIRDYEAGKFAAETVL